MLRRWHLGRPASVANIASLVATADAMASALRAGDIPAVGCHVADYWAQKKRMCDAEPPAVSRMLGAMHAKGLLHGASLAGAGGGGFLLAVTKRPHARKEGGGRGLRFRHTLSPNPESKSARAPPRLATSARAPLV